MSKPPATVLVAPHGTNPELWSFISDDDFELRQENPFYHVIEVSFELYCEWAFNVKSGSIQKVVAVDPDDIVSDFTFERVIPDTTPAGAPPPYHEMDDVSLAFPVRPEFVISDFSASALLFVHFFHRGKFYFQFNNRYPITVSGNEDIAATFNATMTKLTAVWDGEQDDLPFHVTETWTSTDTYY